MIFFFGGGGEGRWRRCLREGCRVERCMKRCSCHSSLAASCLCLKLRPSPRGVKARLLCTAPLCLVYVAEPFSAAPRPRPRVLGLAVSPRYTGGCWGATCAAEGGRVLRPFTIIRRSLQNVTTNSASSPRAVPTCLPRLASFRKERQQQPSPGASAGEV